MIYDAVALLASEKSVATLAQEATARDFVSDAFAHAKFIAYNEAAKPLFDNAGVAPDKGCLLLSNPDDARRFFRLCYSLRFWERESKVRAS